MKSALDSFLLIQHNNKLVILADMLELGKDTDEEHLSIIRYCKANNLNFITLGKQFLKFNENGFENKESLIEYIEKSKLIDYLILLKGSRSMKLEDLIVYL